MLRKSVLVRALTIAFSTAALGAIVATPAMAQSNAAGSVYGSVAPGSATAVVLKNTDTNQSRTVQIDSQGKFQASALAIGHYKATLMNGANATSTSELDVLAGQGVEAVFTSGSSVQ